MRGPVPADAAALLADAQDAACNNTTPSSRPRSPRSSPATSSRCTTRSPGSTSRKLAAGHRFLEWGSGIGIVACLAAELGFDAIGIEIEAPLVEIAESIAADHDIDVEFACGSYVPHGAEPFVDTAGEVTWLRTDAPTATPTSTSSPKTSTSSTPTPGPARSK